MSPHVPAFLLAAALLVEPATAMVEAPSDGAAVSLSDVQDRLRRDGQVRLERMGLVLERADFATDHGAVESIIVRPLAEGKRPGVMVIPGHGRTAYDMMPQAMRFARAGFVVMSVSQPGYGGSTGPADFVGPRTFSALEAAARRLSALPHVDPGRLGIYGYSRGALAAAQLATRTDYFRASVLGGGIYDFKSAMDQVSIPEIRQNMEAEAGRSEEALRYRSPIQDIGGLDGPVLIIHGEADQNAPVAQAHMLDRALTATGHDHQLKIVPGGTHALGMTDVVVPAITFFEEQLAPDGGNPG